MRKTILGIALMAGACSAYAYDMGAVFGAMAAHSGVVEGEENLDHTLSKVAAAMNRTMPVQVDQDTRLDRISAEPGHHLTYHYTMVSLASSAKSTAKFRQVAEPRLKARLCESADMRGFLRSGVTVSYRFRGKDGGVIGESAVSPRDCLDLAKAAPSPALALGS